MWLDHTYGIPGISVDNQGQKGLITFSNIKTGMKVKAIKNGAGYAKGMKFTVSKEEGKKIYITNDKYTVNLSSARFCIDFIKDD